MKIKVHLRICDDERHEETHSDVLVLAKACQRIEPLGLTLAEWKQLLKTLQQHLAEQQATTFVRRWAGCQACGSRNPLTGDCGFSVREDKRSPTFTPRSSETQRSF
jgi:hypothetical protein